MHTLEKSQGSWDGSCATLRNPLHLGAAWREGGIGIQKFFRNRQKMSLREKQLLSLRIIAQATPVSHPNIGFHAEDLL